MTSKKIDVLNYIDLFVMIGLKFFIILPLLHDPFIAKDKTKHFGASYIAVQAVYQTSQSTEKAIVASALLGIGKEFYDLKVKKTTFSFKDLLWDALGIASGILVVKYF